jgi:nucleoid DNA-binding protein
MNNHAKQGKSRLIRELLAKGLSVRRAEKAVNVVFDIMAKAVRRGELVEIPGGSMQAKTMNGKARSRMQRFRNVQTDEINFRIVRYPGRRRVVRFRPDETLDLTPLPEPPTTEELQCRQLAAELIGKPASDAVMERLHRAAAFPPQKPGNLLARLRERQQRGGQYNVESLACEIEKLYWL